jgi:hypothetical protein
MGMLLSAHLHGSGSPRMWHAGAKRRVRIRGVKRGFAGTVELDAAKPRHAEL